MSPQEKQMLKALFVATAMYYGQQIPDAALQLYVDDLEDLPLEKVKEALTALRRDAKTTRCPLPAHIRMRVSPEKDPEQEAVEAVSRIIGAISRIGPYQPKEARMAIGELGWRVVERDGGWTRVCEYLNDDNMAATRAQWRQMALAFYKRAEAGRNDAPSLPGDDRTVLPFLNKTLLPEMPKVKADEGGDE